MGLAALGLSFFLIHSFIVGDPAAAAPSGFISRFCRIREEEAVGIQQGHVEVQLIRQLDEEYPFQLFVVSASAPICCL